MQLRWKRCVSAMLLILLAGCGSQEEQQELPQGQSYMYYLDGEETKLLQETYTFRASDTRGKVEEWIQMQKKPSEKYQQQVLLPGEIEVLQWKLEGEVLWLDFNQAYQELDSTKEVLIRAGLVQMFTQIEGVSYVGILIEGKEYKDQQGVPAGMMNGDSFVEYSGKEINAYQYVTMKLYFSDAKGTNLKSEEQKVYYSKNTPLERVVIEQLLRGPKSEDAYPTIPAETQILSVTTVDGIAYVNLNSTFLNTTLPVQPEVVIQSIVQSLMDSSDILKVQVAVNGDTKVEFMDSVNLDQFFERKTIPQKGDKN